MGVWESFGGGAGWAGMERGVFDENDKGGEVESDVALLQIVVKMT